MTPIKQHVLSVVNVPTSTIACGARGDADAGRTQIGVALRPAAFTCQMRVVSPIAAGRARGELSETDEQKLVHALIEAPAPIK